MAARGGQCPLLPSTDSRRTVRPLPCIAIMCARINCCTTVSASLSTELHPIPETKESTREDLPVRMHVLLRERS